MSLSLLNPANYVTLLGERFSFFGGRKKGFSGEMCFYGGVLGYLDGEEQKTFEILRGDYFYILCRIRYWVSLWASISSAF